MENLSHKICPPILSNASMEPQSEDRGERDGPSARRRWRRRSFPWSYSRETVETSLAVRSYFRRHALHGPSRGPWRLTNSSVTTYQLLSNASMEPQSGDRGDRATRPPPRTVCLKRGGRERGAGADAGRHSELHWSHSRKTVETRQRVRSDRHNVVPVQRFNGATVGRPWRTFRTDHDDMLRSPSFNGATVGRPWRPRTR